MAEIELASECGAVSSSLLRNVDLDIVVPDEFDIGMGDWMSPPKKKARVLVDTTNTKRFAAPVSPVSFKKAAKGVIPANTEASTLWAKKNFDCWTKSRSRSGSECVPDGLLRSHDANLVCKWLCRFVTETRKTDGSVYLCGVSRVFSGNFSNCTFNIS